MKTLIQTLLWVREYIHTYCIFVHPAHDTNGVHPEEKIKQTDDLENMEINGNIGSIAGVVNQICRVMRALLEFEHGNR